MIDPKLFNSSEWLSEIYQGSEIHVYLLFFGTSKNTMTVPW